MAVAEGKTRVMLTLSDALLERVDAYCEGYGLTRSGFFAWVAAEKLSALDRVEGGLLDLAERMLREKEATE